MRDTLSALCNDFIKNRDIIKNTFGWENSYLYPVCASVFTDKRQLADGARMKECRRILKTKTGLFSNFRSNTELAMLAMMAVEENPEERLNQALQVYDVLKKHFWGSEYLSVASMIIADLAAPEEYVQIAARTKEIYNLMKDEHPFLTYSEDSVYAVLLALSRLSNERVVQETESCYRLLKSEFFSGNAVQSLSHVLALGEGSPENKCSKTVALFHDLKAKGYKYGTDYELATLGVLALLPVEQSVLVEDIIQVDKFLEGQKGYGILGLGKKQRLMHAGMIVTSDYMAQSKNTTMNTAVLGATISLIAAQQAAMCAAIAASSAAAAASASS